MICYANDSVPLDIKAIVVETCRKPDNQRAMFMMAGLMVLTDDPSRTDAHKVANTTRSRLHRFFQRNEWAMTQGVLLPRGRTEWYIWFKRQGMSNVLPSQYFAKKDGTLPA